MIRLGSRDFYGFAQLSIATSGVECVFERERREREREKVMGALILGLGFGTAAASRPG